VKLSDYVVDFIAQQGVRHVFMVPGGGAMHLNDSLGRHTGLRYVCNLHEQASAIAAEAYGQYSGLGVAMVTTGPGGTNAITGVAGAWLESTPMLVISGQVKRPDLVGGRGVRQIGFQEIDIVSLVKPITKFAVVVTDPERIRLCLEEAAWTATHGRKGPVWVDIPLDVQAAEIEPADLESFVPPHGAPSTAEEIRAAARKTAAILAQSRRPVVLAGNGIRHAGAVPQFLKWAEGIGIPILTTWKALDYLPGDHPLYVGRPGAVGQRAANFAQQKSDALVSIGARLDFGQTAYSHANFAPRAKRVVVDIDPNEIAKLQMELSVGLAADAGVFLAELDACSKELTFPDWSDWRGTLRLVEGPLSHRAGVLRVRPLGRPQLCPRRRDRQPACGPGTSWSQGSSGACSEVTAQAVPVSAPACGSSTRTAWARWVSASRRRSAPAWPRIGKRTVCIDGDGGFPMNAHDLAVVSHLKLPIKFFVLVNGGYGSIRATQANYFQSRFVACDAASGLVLPDLRKTAESCGIAFRDDLRPRNGLAASGVGRSWRRRGPSVCAVLMAPDQFTQPKVSSRQEPGAR
jgi:acetolactate synthase-1/2/3 large subunit